MEFRNFTRDDWAGWSGCESDAPFIGDGPDFTVVVDGTWVEVHPHKDTGPWLSLQFPGLSMAVAFAMSLRGSEPPEIVALLARQHSVMNLD